MKFLPTGSLQSFLSAPQFRPHKNLKDLPLQSIAPRTKKYWDEIGKNGGKVFPDREAVSFYCLNHLASIVRSKFTMYEPLPTWAQSVMKAYVECLAKQSERLFHYMLLIITRESRHMYDPDEEWWQKAAFHPAVQKFLKELDESEIASVKQLCDKPPEGVKLGEYVDAIVYVFNEGSFNSGYGGKPWGNIAKCLGDMVNGVTSLEMMVDSSYSLAHNNGPMFNKDMLYSHYNTEEFIKILDVQRSGQVPEMVLNNEVAVSYIDDEVRTLAQLVQKEVPNAFGTYVDWYKVEKLGSMKKYPAQKKMQVKKYGEPPKEPEKPVKVEGTPFKAMPSDIKDFTLLPDVTIKQFKRSAA